MRCLRSASTFPRMRRARLGGSSPATTSRSSVSIRRSSCSSSMVFPISHRVYRDRGGVTLDRSSLYSLCPLWLSRLLDRQAPAYTLRQLAPNASHHRLDSVLRHLEELRQFR